MKVTEDGVPVQDVIAAVKLAIIEANISTANKDRDLRVGSVKLILHALATRSLGGRLSFTVPVIGMAIRLGTKVTRSDTHEIEINLVIPDHKTAEEIREASLDTALADAIETVRAVVANASKGDDPFALKDAKITLSFVITSEGDISIGIDGTMSDELTNTLVLKLLPA